MTAARSVRQPFVDRQWDLGEQPRDPVTGLAVAVQAVGCWSLAGEMAPDGGLDVLPLIIDIDDIRAAFSSGLASADIHGGHAQERTFPDGDARVADDTGAVVREPEEILRRHVPEQVNILRALPLAKDPDGLRRAIGPGVGVRPEPQRRKGQVLDGE